MGETPTPSPRRLLKDYFTPLFFGRGLSCPLSYLSLVRMGKEKKFKLTPDKKKKLRVLILKRAQDDLKREEEAKQRQKDDFLSAKIPPLNIEGLNMTALKDQCVKLYQK